MVKPNLNLFRGLRIFALILFFVGVFFAPQIGFAAGPAQSLSVNIPLGDSQGMSTPVKLMLVVTFLSFLPALFISLTSFVRIIIVFSFLRQAMGMPQAPPNQVLIGLSLFLTFAIMSPVFGDIYTNAVNPYIKGAVSEEVAFEEFTKPLRGFMFRQTRTSDINLMLQIAKTGEVSSPDDVPTSVLIPAFMLSELKTAFQIGFMLYIPFVVMDMIVAMTLLSMGMMVLPPVIISLPFKVMLFVVVNGWDLVMTSLIKSFR